MDHKQLVRDALDFAEKLRGLGYNEVSFLNLTIDQFDHIRASYWCEDDFQEKAEYKHRVQHGTQSFAWPFDARKLYNREERELRVLLAQQGDSTALQQLFVSAAGRKFVDQLVAERSKYAALVDWSDNDD